MRFRENGKVYLLGRPSRVASSSIIARIPVPRKQVNDFLSAVEVGYDAEARQADAAASSLAKRPYVSKVRVVVVDVRT